MHYLLISLKSSQLTKKQIEEICELKNQQWKYKLQSQINYYKENIKHNDIHNLFYINNKLIGYTLLRKRTLVRKKTFSIDKIDKSSKYLLFDTLIIDKKFRGKKLSDIIMNSLLGCKKELVSLYKKFGWVTLKKKYLTCPDYLFSGNAMIYNKKNLITQKYIFFVNR